MKVKNLVVGPLETNCYLIEIDNDILIIDPGDEKEKIINACADKNCLGILLTHRHFDHVGALNDIKDFYNIPVYDRGNLKEQDYQIGPFYFSVIFTPGHTDDSISFYFKKEGLLFSGDFIFKGTIGRTDLGGNMVVMKDSINKIKNYAHNVLIKPGHGLDTNLNNEIKNNPFFY